ncbi:MAG: hypothetical protein A2298_05135 [Gammaproteobacteria bacterium RIFOXYB2_FULL_38_6]|nr:MAG: hypothetical protein A2298_05135 [Gammaproteobacteria bacterium RIFOXYB2_FULL_38_6]
MTSKTFDNGTICASEQSIIVEEEIDFDVRRAFEHQGGYFLSDEEIKKITPCVIDPKTGLMSPEVVGQPVSKLIEMAGLRLPKSIRLLLAPVEKIGAEEPLSKEILAPILSYYVRRNFDEAVKACIDLNHSGGLGHTASIYSNDENKIALFCDMVDAGRVVINTPSSQGAVGGIFNMLTPSLTLGCGAGGKNITAENITAKHLINIKRCAHRRNNEKLMRMLPQDKYLDEKFTLEDILLLYNKNF